MKSRYVVCCLLAVLYFRDQLFATFYRLFYKVGKLWYIDLKFSGFNIDLNFDNPAKFPEVSTPRSFIFKNRVFWTLVCSLQTRPVISEFIFDFLFTVWNAIHDCCMSETAIQVKLIFWAVFLDGVFLVLTRTFLTWPLNSIRCSCRPLP